AEADKKIAQAKAEERRAIAVAAEQENRALVEARRAKLVEAQAQVPLAPAEALPGRDDDEEEQEKETQKVV
ncbi:flotillin-like FloA family protein, partial [Thermus scotoductus]|uniref:flotillin-like FloA family protein n=1 Tax=Thermus scotoductus TaxID=37636 RepID=UPI0010015214